MNSSLPESLRSYVEVQTIQRRFSTTSECIRELIRRDHDRQHLRGSLLAGAATDRGSVADRASFDSLRGEIETSEDA